MIELLASFEPFAPVLSIVLLVYLFLLWYKSNDDLTERKSKKNLSLNKEFKMKYCPNCGTEAKEMRYCSSCGANLQAGNPHSYQPKSQVIAFILCFFCGPLGFHRFYVGKIGTGILMLFMMPFVIFGAYLMDEIKIGRTLSETGDTIALFICGPLTLILVIWVLIDLISILTGSFTKAYNSEYVNSGNGEPIRTKDKGSRIGFWVIIILFLIFLMFLMFFQYSKEQRVQQKNATEERAARYIDSLVRENSLRQVPTVPQKKKAGSSKKSYGLQLAPEQPQEVLKVQKSTKSLEFHKIENGRDIKIELE